MEPLSTTTRTAVGAHDFSNEYPDMVLSPGSTLYDYFGPSHGYSIAHGWVWGQWSGFVLTVLGAIFIPFLPHPPIGP